MCFNKSCKQETINVGASGYHAEFQEWNTNVIVTMSESRIIQKLIKGAVEISKFSDFLMQKVNGNSSNIMCS